MSCPVRRCGPSGPASPVPCRRGCSCHVPGPGGPLHRKRSTWPSASSSTLSCRRTALFGPTCDDRGTGLPSWVSSHPVSTHKLRVLTTVQHLFPRSARDRRLTGALAEGWHWCDPRRPSGETSVWQVPRPAQPRHGSAPQVSVDMCVAEPGTTGPRRSGCRQVNPAGPAAPRTFSVPPISTATFAPVSMLASRPSLRVDRAAAGCSEPVFSFEGEVEQCGQGGDEGGGGGESPVGGVAAVGQVLAVETGDRGGYRDDRRPAGHLLHEEVHPVGLDGQVGLVSSPRFHGESDVPPVRWSRVGWLMRRTGWWGAIA